MKVYCGLKDGDGQRKVVCWHRGLGRVDIEAGPGSYSLTMYAVPRVIIRMYGISLLKYVGGRVI